MNKLSYLYNVLRIWLGRFKNKIMARNKKVIEHQIVDITDVFNVVNKDNFETFMLDFMLFVHQIGELKEKHPEIKVQAMLWKDDGINEITGCSINGNRIIFSKKKQ